MQERQQVAAVLLRSSASGEEIPVGMRHHIGEAEEAAVAG
jgi:hypothetical protein